MYFSGFDAWADWTSAAHEWLLLGDIGAFTATDDNVSDIVTTELLVAGYARITVANKVDDDQVSTYYNSRSYGADPPVFSGLAAGKYIQALVLAETTGRLLAFWDVQQPSDVGTLALNFATYTADNGDPLPSAGPNTQMIHQQQARA